MNARDISELLDIDEPSEVAGELLKRTGLFLRFSSPWM